MVTNYPESVLKRQFMALLEPKKARITEKQLLCMKSKHSGTTERKRDQLSYCIKLGG